MHYMWGQRGDALSLINARHSALSLAFHLLFISSVTIYESMRRNFKQTKCNNGQNESDTMTLLCSFLYCASRAKRVDWIQATLYSWMGRRHNNCGKWNYKYIIHQSLCKLVQYNFGSIFSFIIIGKYWLRLCLNCLLAIMQNKLWVTHYRIKTVALTFS